MSEIIFCLESAKACLCSALGILCPPLMSQDEIDTAMGEAIEKRDELLNTLTVMPEGPVKDAIRSDIEALDNEIAHLQEQQERLHTENSQARIDALEEQIDKYGMNDTVMTAMQNELETRKTLHDLGIVNPELQDGVLGLAGSDHQTDRNTADRILDGDVQVATFVEVQVPYTDTLAKYPDFDPSTQMAVYIDPDDPEKGIRKIGNRTWGLAPRDGDVILINTERINDNEDIQSTLVHEVNHVLNHGSYDFVPDEYPTTQDQKNAIRSFTTEVRANIAEREFNDEINKLASASGGTKETILSKMGIPASDPNLTSGEKLVLDQVSNFANPGVDLSSMTDEQRGQLERIFITDKLTNPNSSNYENFKKMINSNDSVVLNIVDEIITDGPGGNLGNSAV